MTPSFPVSLARAGDVRRCSILNTWLTPLGLARAGDVVRSNCPIWTVASSAWASRARVMCAVQLADSASCPLSLARMGDAQSSSEYSESFASLVPRNFSCKTGSFSAMAPEPRARVGPGQPSLRGG